MGLQQCSPSPCTAWACGLVWWERFAGRVPHPLSCMWAAEGRSWEERARKCMLKSRSSWCFSLVISPALHLGWVNSRAQNGVVSPARARLEDASLPDTETRVCRSDFALGREEGLWAAFLCRMHACDAPAPREIRAVWNNCLIAHSHIVGTCVLNQQCGANTTWN
ncbi:hypothetical protein F5144DRAFT_120192 [Chaetomium tenue]|uniref:Uncharacterized protein n=1 Tax=Chaetomium tenue TaxID=1854479 RepID=A0ACB7PKW4_9PEZI|nr:hypothetical protein F5144DRAFT_120192 [Chaetomium globosum]